MALPGHGSSYGRFTVLLILLPLAILIAPLMEESVAGRILFNVFITALLLGSVHAAGLRRHEKVTAWGLVGVTVLIRWAGHAMGDMTSRVAGEILTSMFFVYVTVQLFFYVVRAGHVDMNVVSAALCVYLLLGITFALLYTTLDLVAPGSFAMPADHDMLRLPKSVSLTQNYIYFSLITMTTTGFGDIVPVSRFARSLTVVEVLLGQIYLVVMIARLVSLWSAAPAGRP